MARQAILALHKPDGFNIGINVGDAAGQTVPHLHVHVIPRYAGDVADPRGGVRHVIPGRANYLAGAAASARPTGVRERATASEPRARLRAEGASARPP
jgi:diadenosine tetraphosphate (Ap4A) HIT family hydrolase